MKLLSHIGSIAVLVVGSFASTVSAQTTANGPYYATPSWDQQLPGSTRFVVLSNWIDADFPAGGAAVLDRETGLVWEHSPSACNPGIPTCVWQSAQFHCNQLRVGNRQGWRLPTVQELASLVDPTVTAPSLPTGNPFMSVQLAGYWSATTFGPGGAWDVEFSSGGVSTIAKSTSLNVWCVRGGQGVDPQ